MALERLRLERGYFRAPSGKPVYLIGANFWPKNSGPFMYRDPWDAAAIGRDLDDLAVLGANCARIFCFWPDFMPEPNSVSPEALSRFDALVELCAGRGLWSIPTFLVGHMSGENWDPPWRGQRDLYADEFALQCQERMIAAMAGKYKEDPRIAAWLVTNEWPLYAGSTADDRGIAWAQRVCGALRAADPGRPVSLGDGTWDLAWGQPTGLPARRLSGIVDFLGPHFYPKETDSLRHSLVAPFVMRMAAPFGMPVLMEEFGCSSDQSEDTWAAGYYRTVLWSALGAGNCGALAWNSHDFTLADRPPYAHHPYELHFGLFRSDGTRKPQADAFAEFARVAAAFEFDDWEPAPSRALIARTAYFLESFPFDWGWSKSELRDLYLQTYALCVKAGFGAGFCDLSSERIAAPLLILPCLQQITTQDAAALFAFVEAGGTAYVSYGGEPWHPDLARLIGAKPQIRYGLVERAVDPILLRFAADFGDLHSGEGLELRARGVERRAAMLRCAPVEAEVLATDAAGDPALLGRRLGKGRVIFSVYPLEYYLMHGLEPNAADEATWRVYRALALEAGVPLDVVEGGGAVQRFVWKSRSDPRAHRALFVNHGDREANVAPVPPVSEPVSVPPKGIRMTDVNVPA